jgi:ABC-2 type transport system ATP-binding protein
VLDIGGISKRFGSRQALADVTFAVRPGEVFGFVGSNGAGKTTTMRIVLGVLEADAGEVRWKGSPIDAELRRRIGYMPEERGLYPKMTVRDQLVYLGRLHGLTVPAVNRNVDELLEWLSLGERANDPVENLSLGNQQRAQIAAALVHDPDVLVLDEPFSGLDPIAVEVLGEILREQVAAGAALLLSSHQLDLVADVCSAVVIVDHGRVVLRGDVAEIRSASPTRYLDVEFATPTPWRPSVASLSTDGDRRYRATVDVDADARGLIADAHTHGEVTAYAFSPPDLSEVFLGAVGRDTVEDALESATERGADR